MWMHMHRFGNHCHAYLEDMQPGLSRKVFGGVIVSSVIVHLAVRGYKLYRARRTVRERGEAAREACENLRKHLEEEGPADEEKEAAIVKLTLPELQQKLRKGELTAVEVLRAYQRKALQVDAALNCVTEPIWEAEAIVVELDQLRPNQRKPLHGIPVSIKDSISLEGYDCHIGFSELAFKTMERDADVVQVLKSQGAVPFVRTNFPQGLLSIGCSNPIYGQTLNPHDPKRAPGGSSGGEGALLGGGGSILGLGTDIGGSIRIPSQMCGVYGLKPTVDRLGTNGTDPLVKGQNLVRMTVGPMARDMGGLIEMSRSIFVHKMYTQDPYVPPVPFREELFEKKTPMRIGFYTHLEGTQCHPTCVRAVMEAKQALETRGHTVIEFNPPRPMDCCCDLYIKACFADEGEETGKLLKNDVVDDSAFLVYYSEKLPRFFRYVLGTLIQLKDPLLGRIIKSAAMAPRTIAEWWKQVERTQEYKKEFTTLWQQKKLDAVISPVIPFPAVTCGTEAQVTGGIYYTTLYNLLNYPAGILPVTKVTQEDVEKLRDPRVYPVTGNLEKEVKKDSDGSVGLPVCVQCIGLPYQEEVVLRLMQEIDSAIWGR